VPKSRFFIGQAPHAPVVFAPMSQKPPQDSRIAANLVLDTLLTAGAFVIFFFVCRGHVASDDPHVVNLWGAITASCLAGVFWLALQMFKVTLRGQRDRSPRD
jgi:hypothetical protein